MFSIFGGIPYNCDMIGQIDHVAVSVSHSHNCKFQYGRRSQTADLGREELLIYARLSQQNAFSKWQNNEVKFKIQKKEIFLEEKE